MIKRFLKIILLFLILTLFFARITLAQKPKSSKFILILINQTGIEDLQKAQTPFLDSLIREGAFGLLSPRTAASKNTPGRSYTTIGAGNRAKAPSLISSQAFNSFELYEGGTAKEAYQRRTGLKLKDQEVLHLGAFPLKEKNEELPFGAIPGSLGEELKKAHLKRTVLGNADTSLSFREETLHREAVAIAMDKQGLVDLGDVSKEILEEDKESPFGLRTNFEILMKKFRENQKSSAFIVIDLGDSPRADLYGEVSSPEIAERFRLEALEKADNFLKEFFSLIDLKETRVVILSATPPLFPLKKEELTPIIMVGKGVKPGFLTSSTTLRKGLVSLTDIAPTVLDFFGLKRPANFTGRVMASLTSPSRDKVSFLSRFNEQAVFRDIIEPPTIITFIVFQIIIYFLSLSALTLKKSLRPRSFLLLSGALLAILIFPLSLFLLPLFLGGTLKYGTTFLISLISLTLLSLIFLSLGRKKRMDSLILVSLATFLVLSLDLFLGGRSHINSVFGYSPIVGGRFYGLGNQGMALLLAAAILGSSLFLERQRNFSGRAKIFLAGLFLFLIFLIGFPRLGANIGGTITAIFALGVTYFQFLKRKIRGKEILALVLGIIIILSLFITFDFLQKEGKKTHLGKATELIQAQGSKAFLEIGERKLTTNLRILRYSPWSYLLLAILGLLIYLRFRPAGEFKRLFSKYPYLAAGVAGALTGGVVGFLTNDSGIVIPALILSYFLAAIFYLMVQEKNGLKVHPVRNTKVLRERKQDF